jgi:hypothetical protein
VLKEPPEMSVGMTKEPPEMSVGTTKEPHQMSANRIVPHALKTIMGPHRDSWALWRIKTISRDRGRLSGEGALGKACRLGPLAQMLQAAGLMPSH